MRPNLAKSCKLFFLLSVFKVFTAFLTVSCLSCETIALWVCLTAAAPEGANIMGDNYRHTVKFAPCIFLKVFTHLALDNGYGFNA